ncbi:MAG TPA: inorganic diphosphatase [Bryobacteraceae bacterium]|nr:inorganic diphosphatase [Bryobacteraceae bacterium]
MRLYDIDPGPESPELVRAIIEIPKNSSNKYEYDGELNLFRLDRALYSPMHYPGDYGFVPGTLAEDGDPLDVLTLVDEPSFTGCIMEVRPVGVLYMVDQKENDQKLLAVPNRNPRFDSIHTMDQVFPHVRREIEHFFSIYKELQGANTTMKGWGGPSETRKLITRCRQAYLDGRVRQAAAIGQSDQEKLSPPELSSKLPPSSPES